ncbi:cytochrome P450 [Tepidamorphus sp. 3E244]|uniref:cytochrome P450 n=1 Tax=Tepidamorphus sp. 3E244 TaxID=3385498 RepID=UPI0038FC86E6
MSDLIAFQRDQLGFFLQRGNDATEPLVRLSMGTGHVYLVSDADLVRPIMKADESVIDKGRLIYKLREIIGESSMVLSGEEHRKRRAVMHAQMSRGVTSEYVPEISAIIRQCAAQMAMSGSFDAHQVTASLAVRIIATILFGHGVLTTADENALINALHLAEDDLAAQIFKIIPDLPWVRSRKKAKLSEANKTMEFVVEKARSNAKRHSLISALEELNLSEKAMQEEILLNLLAGHHTSGSAASWVLYFLGKFPDLAEEIAQEARGLTDANGEIDPRRLSSAKTSLAFVKETLRLYPSAYWLSRETKQEMELGGRKLPAGSSLLISPWQMQRNPRYWPEPEKFDITRNHSGAAYMPFGSGPRVCVGMSLALLELQLFALEIAASFEVDLGNNVTAPPPIPAITIIPPPMEMRVTPRATPQHQQMVA